MSSRPQHLSSHVPGTGSSPTNLTPEIRSTVRVLVVDDERTICESAQAILRQSGYQVQTCGRGDEAAKLLHRHSFDVVLIDLYMSRVPGMQLLDLCLEHREESLAIVITGNPCLETNIEALRRGAFDYLAKPFSATQLTLLVERAALTALVARETRRQDIRLSEDHGHGSEIMLLGRSPSFLRVIELAKKVAPTEASVFITGESGTGKELIAQFIHRMSRRSSRAFVALNCAAIPEALLESELFGHMKGAFTGAVQDKPGLLETANGGTCFLDELTEMPSTVQAKLLRAIQDGRIRRVGSAAPTDSVTTIRFIAATNRDAQQSVETGLLRKDLYYRLRVVPVELPPLRERLDDIPILATHFCARFWRRNAPPGAPLPVLTPAAMRALQARSWPGNIRELQNVIEHALVLASPGAELGPDNLPLPESQDSETRLGLVRGKLFLEENYHAAREHLISEFERTYVLWLVDQAEGNISEASRIAGVDRTTLYRLMDKHNLSLTRQVPKTGL